MSRDNAFAARLWARQVRGWRAGRASVALHCAGRALPLEHGPGGYDASANDKHCMTGIRRLAFLLVIAAIVVSPIVAAELLLRRAGLGDPILFEVRWSYRFAPVPNQSQVRRRGAKVTIDSKGLRSVRDWASPADGKVLFVGDSVTWGGSYIDDEDTFAAGVCARLQAATGRHFVCGNAGTNEYGTDNMAARIRYKTFEDETALVVTVIADDTLRGLKDADAAFVFTAAPPGPFKALWEATAFVVWRLNRAMRPFQPVPSKDDHRVAERSLENLLAAVRETARPGRKVLFVLSPLAAELNGKELELTRVVRATLERSGFPFLDLHAAVSVSATPDFYYDGIHLERRGHQFYADQIARRLLEMGEGGEKRQ
jgi:lysophospholipase L1-like esterase